MKTKFLFLLALVLLSAGCATEGDIKSKNPNVRIYLADLRGDERKMIVQTEDKTATDSTSVVTIKNHDRIGDTIDSFSIPGKIKNVEFAKLNLEDQESIVVYFCEKAGLSSVAIYRLKNEKLSRIFLASSAYGIETDFESAARIRIGKKPRESQSPSIFQNWDYWVWSGDKFVRE